MQVWVSTPWGGRQETRGETSFLFWRVKEGAHIKKAGKGNGAETWSSAHGHACSPLSRGVVHIRCQIGLILREQRQWCGLVLVNRPLLQPGAPSMQDWCIQPGQEWSAVGCKPLIHDLTILLVLSCTGQQELRCGKKGSSGGPDRQGVEREQETKACLTTLLNRLHNSSQQLVVLVSKPVVIDTVQASIFKKLLSS